MPIDLHSSITIDRVLSAVSADDGAGFCTHCGADQSPVEPDAEKHQCHTCGLAGVYGAEQLLLLCF